MKKFIFKNENAELLLPVTPPSFEISHGINIETINIHTLGDVVLPGYGVLNTLKINCMFPAKEYPFNQPGANLNPYSYTEKLTDWCNKKHVVRFIVSDTPVNVSVLVESVTYGEKDGTGDVYATIQLREYRQLSVIPTDKTENKSRTGEKSTNGVQNYVIKKGDTLSVICRMFYGNASLYSKLAAYNNIKNPHIITAGKTLKIPNRSLL